MIVDPQHWSRLKDVLQRALEYPEADRTAFVLDACAGDDSLVREVHALLALQSSAGDLLEGAGAEALRLLAAEPDTLAGRRIGPYRLEREIGRGGMGTVYLGTRDDHQYQHDVAIKLVKRGMDSDLVLRRFRYERQILANLTHPNIARLFDGGTTDDGLPYFVMEYVAGVPIDEYCDTHGLSVAERLTLFGTVCAAVQHAHNNLVIHRDLKPTNILVTADGIPKLLDFGIAKVIDTQDEPAFTSLTVLGRPMTPEYASPEQARGEPITVAADVYSLGVLLYQLLTGRRPYVFTNHGPEEITRVICQEQPLKPSTAVGRPDGGEGRLPVNGDIPGGPPLPPKRLRRQLRGDLDNLVLMALRKEPQRRYASVEQLSEDVQRFLERRPLRARPDTLAYRTARFVQRNRVAVVAAVLVAVTLVGGIVATTRAAQRAERRFNDVRALANSVVFEIHDAIKDLPGATPARALLVRRALQYLDGLAGEASGDAMLQLELAAAYQKIGDVQGNQNYSNLGDTPGALASYQKAVAIHEALIAAQPGHIQAHHDLSGSYVKIGDMLLQTGDSAKAKDTYLRALSVAEAARRVDSTPVPALRNLALCHHKVGNALMATNELADALTHHRAALELREAIAASAPTDVRAHREVSISAERMARVLRRQGDFSGALDYARRALAVSESLAARDPANAELRRDVGVGLQGVGLIQTQLGDLRGALANFQNGLEIDEAMAAADPKNAGAQRDLASSHETIAEVLSKLNEPTEALASYTRAVTVLERLAASDPASVDPPSALTAIWAQRGELYGRLGSDVTLSRDQRAEHWRAARSAFERSLRTLGEMTKRGITPSVDVRSPEALADDIRKCDAALSALTRS
jgi:non-specific serine/threonine protein kinase/serine/threonine-protein kinase